MTGRKKSAKKGAGGRPTELTPEIIAAIAKVLRNAGTVEDVARYVGVDPGTFYRWQARGRSKAGKGTIFAKLAEEVEKAKSARRIAFELHLVAVGRKSAKAGGDWKAYLALMERLEPKRYAPRVRVHVEEELEGAIRKLERRLPPERFEEVLSILAEDDSGEETQPDPGGA